MRVIPLFLAEEGNDTPLLFMSSSVNDDVAASHGGDVGSHFEE